MSSYVYLGSEPGLWTVGFYRPSGEWEPESDHESSEAAAARVAWLNGSVTNVDEEVRDVPAPQPYTDGSAS
jgi:hypothetical protein